VVRFPVDKVAVVPEILPHVKLSNDDCHWILPALPVKVIVLPVPEHTDEDIGVAVPPTEAGVTVTVSWLVVSDKPLFEQVIIQI